MVEILGTPIRALLDSGASISVISSMDLISRWNLKIEPTKFKVQTANKERLNCVGFVYLPFTFNHQTKVIPTVVIPEIAKDLICGYDFWKAFNIRPTIGNDTTLELDDPFQHLGMSPSIQTIDIQFLSPWVLNISIDETAPELNQEEVVDESLDIPSLETPNEQHATAESLVTEHILSSENKQKLVEIVNMFPKSYDGKIGRTPLLTHNIELLPDATPRKIPSYKCSPKVEEEVDKEIERLIKMDAIEECSSDFVNPLLPVKKPNGKWRLD